MNITTNYSVQTSQLKNNRSIRNSVSEQTEPSQINNSVSFQGIPHFLKTGVKKVVKMDNNTKEFLERTGSILGVKSEELEKQAEGKTVGHMRLLNAMAERYNSTNFSKPANEKENSDIVLNIFNRIKQPDEEHIGFVNRVRMTITDIDKCFNRCEDDPQKISKLESVYYKLK